MPLDNTYCLFKMKIESWTCFYLNWDNTNVIVEFQLYTYLHKTFVFEVRIYIDGAILVPV